MFDDWIAAMAAFWRSVRDGFTIVAGEVNHFANNLVGDQVLVGEVTLDRLFVAVVVLMLLAGIIVRINRPRTRTYRWGRANQLGERQKQRSKSNKPKPSPAPEQVEGQGSEETRRN